MKIETKYNINQEVYILTQEDKEIVLMNSEKDTQTAVINHAKSLGCVALALKDRSMPDRCFVKDGKMLFIEFKAPGKKPRKSQMFMFKKLEAKGHPVHVVDDALNGVKLIDEHFN